MDSMSERWTGTGRSLVGDEKTGGEGLEHVGASYLETGRLVGTLCVA